MFLMQSCIHLQLHVSNKLKFISILKYIHPFFQHSLKLYKISEWLVQNTFKLQKYDAESIKILTLKWLCEYIAWYVHNSIYMNIVLLLPFNTCGGIKLHFIMQIVCAEFLLKYDSEVSLLVHKLVDNLEPCCRTFQTPVITIYNYA